jgi:hypothetical protein
MTGSGGGTRDCVYGTRAAPLDAAQAALDDAVPILIGDPMTTAKALIVQALVGAISRSVST